MCFVCTFLIATLPTVILADGGGADCSASFEPPPAVHDPLSFGVVRMSVPKTPSETPPPHAHEADAEIRRIIALNSFF